MQKTGRVAKWLRMVAVIFFLFSMTTFGNFYPSANAREHTVYTLEESTSYSKANANYTVLSSMQAVSDQQFSSAMIQNRTVGAIQGVLYKVGTGKQFRITGLQVDSDIVGADRIQMIVGYGASGVRNSASEPTTAYRMQYLLVDKAAGGEKTRDLIPVNLVVPAGQYPYVYGDCTLASCQWIYNMYGYEELANTNVTSINYEQFRTNSTYTLKARTYTVNQTMEAAWTAINSTLAVYSIGTLLFMLGRKLQD